MRDVDSRLPSHGSADTTLGGSIRRALAGSVIERPSWWRGAASHGTRLDRTNSVRGGARATDPGVATTRGPARL